MDSRTSSTDSYDDFKNKCEAGGLILAHWCGSRECETKVREETKASIRNLSFEHKEEKGSFIACGKPSTRRVHLARPH